MVALGAHRCFTNGCQMLSCGPAEHESAVSAVVAERSALTRERKSLLEELAKLHAERLAAQLDAQGARMVVSSFLVSRALFWAMSRMMGAADGETNTDCVVWLDQVQDGRWRKCHRLCAHSGGSAAYHRDGSDLQFLSSVAAAVRELLPDALVLLTASTGAQPPVTSAA